MIWECPICHKQINQNSICSFCGAELIPFLDGRTLKIKTENPCPKCGAIIDESCWYCINCNTKFTEKIEMLKNLQKRIRFEQERIKKEFLPSWMEKNLDKGELIYYCFSFKPKGNDFYVITDSKLIKSKNGHYQEIKLKDIVSIGNLEVETNIFSAAFGLSVGHFSVNTYSGTIIFDGFKQLDARSMGTLSGMIKNAVNNFSLKLLDSRKKILLLNLRNV